MLFSVVIPVADADYPLVRRTLSSWIALGADDLVLCVDKPASHRLVKEVDAFTRSGDDHGIRMVEVERSSEWGFHQAHVRRAGFEQARHDAILTGDVDLVVKPSAARLVDLVGKDRVGLASCLRLPAPLAPAQVLRAWAYFFKEKLLPPVFSGLYAMWRPYWRETEDAGIRSLPNARTMPYGTGGGGIIGEDTYLFLCMRRKYRCIALPQVRAISLTRNVEDLPVEQFSWGRLLASSGLNPPMALLASVGFAYPHLWRGFLYQRRTRDDFLDPFGRGFRP